MTRSEKAQRVAETLERLYPTTTVPLEHRDPFTLLVAVVLSAQTTDKKVNQVTPQLFARAPDPAGARAETSSRSGFSLSVEHALNDSSDTKAVAARGKGFMAARRSLDRGFQTVMRQ